MADFENITGWRDELEAFAQSKEGRAYFRGETVGKTKKLTFDAVLDLARLLLKHDELREAVRQEVEFRAFLETRPDLSSEDDEYWDLNPVQAAETRNKFRRWYAFKSNITYDYLRLNYAEDLAFAFTSGELESLEYEAAKNYAKENFGISFIYSEDGA